jgi:hypothetical protein
MVRLLRLKHVAVSMKILNVITGYKVACHFIHVSFLLKASSCNCLCCWVQGITAILSDEGTNGVYIRVASVFGESVMSLLSDLRVD